MVVGDEVLREFALHQSGSLSILLYEVALGELAEVCQTALGSVHDDALLLEVEVYLHALFFVVEEREAHDVGLAWGDVGFYFECAVVACEEVTLYVWAGVIHGDVADGLGVLAHLAYLVHYVGGHVDLAVVGEELQLAWQGVGTAVLLYGGNVGILPVAHPWHCNDAVAGVGEGDGSVVVLAPVEPLDGLGLGVALELLAVELADEVLCGTAAVDEAGVDVYYHDVLLARLVTVHIEWEEVGALKLVGLRTVTVAPLADVGPLLQVL